MYSIIKGFQLLLSNWNLVLYFCNLNDELGVQCPNIAYHEGGTAHYITSAIYTQNNCSFTCLSFSSMWYIFYPYACALAKKIVQKKKACTLADRALPKFDQEFTLIAWK